MTKDRELSVEELPPIHRDLEAVEALHDFETRRAEGLLALARDRGIDEPSIAKAEANAVRETEELPGDPLAVLAELRVCIEDGLDGEENHQEALALVDRAVASYQARELPGDGQRTTAELTDELTKVWVCPRRLPSGRACGFVQAEPGSCPYDHPEEVALTPVPVAWPPLRIGDAEVDGEALSRALDAFCETYGHRITWSEVYPIVATASGVSIEPSGRACPDCVEGLTHDVQNGEPVVETCSSCRGSGVRDTEPGDGQRPGLHDVLVTAADALDTAASRVLAARAGVRLAIDWNVTGAPVVRDTEREHEPSSDLDAVSKAQGERAHVDRAKR